MFHKSYAMWLRYKITYIKQNYTLRNRYILWKAILSIKYRIIVRVYYGGGGGGVEQYSARLSCFTGLVKLIRSVEESWVAAVVVEFLLHGIGGGGANITAFFWFVLRDPGLGRLRHCDLYRLSSELWIT